MKIAAPGVEEMRQFGLALENLRLSIGCLLRLDYLSVLAQHIKKTHPFACIT